VQRCYTAGRLTQVEQQGLDDDGPTAGVQADCTSTTECRKWLLAWNGDDLERITFPDGTAREFTYGETSLPGYMTRHHLVGADGMSRRVEAAWEYTGKGRIQRIWRGAESFASGVDPYEFVSYDDESQPTQVEVEDAFGDVATYQLEYDPSSSAPRLKSVSGDCPACAGPNTQYEYGIAEHALRPSAVIDGNGNRTELTYTTVGEPATRTEAAGTAEERLITFGYDAAFPGLKTLERWPGTDGVSFREKTWSYHAVTGVLDSMTVSGDEPTYDLEGDGAPEGSFNLTTAYSGHNAAGQPTQLDPPGFGVTDATTFSYSVPGRNGQFPDSRTDPLVGSTTYSYDGLNRRVGVTDPNGVTTETTYDPLDRVSSVISAAGTADALESAYEYNDFGDLQRVVHPRGNVTVYFYDAAGRLEEIQRRAGAGLAAGDESVLYGLNDVGQRVREELAVYDGITWQTERATEYDYSSRCELDRVIHDPDDGATMTTEYSYDCNTNLVAVWDAKHPSLQQANPPTQVYVYDALDRLVEVRAPWVEGTDCRGEPAPSGCAVTSYGYDEQDHLDLVTDAEANTTTYSYSDRDLLISEVSPVSGTTTHRYDDHGQLVETTDARNVTVSRELDVLGRILAVNHPAGTPDTTFSYDTSPAACGGSSYPVGRLSSIMRDASSVDYCYDAHGRTTRDGDLTYGYDANGNRTEIGHPGGVRALYAYDLVADRPVSLTVETPNTAAGGAPVVPSVTYLPSGPVASLYFANGISETREHTKRYFPDLITWSLDSALSWDYATDEVGNVLSIQPAVACSGDETVSNQTFSTTAEVEACAGLTVGPDVDLTATADVTFRAAGAVSFGDGFAVASGGTMRVEAGAVIAAPEPHVFEYHHSQYFLTRGDGPWGDRSWTYDRIGNRLTETRPGGTDTYAYLTNGTCDPTTQSCNTAILDQVTGLQGARGFSHGLAGHLEEVDRGANVIHFSYDAAGRMSQSQRTDDTGSTVYATADFNYDGRSYLREAPSPDTGAYARPLYSSDGLLHALTRRDSSSDPESTYHLFHLAGRPVAQLVIDGATDTWTYIGTDHLGTPALLTDEAGEEAWLGPFEPFGADPAAGTAASALANNVFLRFPGQWEDPTWEDAMLGAGGYYNVYRWYTPGTGRYTKVDPLGVAEGDENAYTYAVANPLLATDPLGLRSRVCCRKIPYLGRFRHCAIQIEQNENTTTCGLFGGRFTPGEEPGVGQVRPNHPFDRPGSPDIKCGPWNETCEVDDCVIQTANSYANPSKYRVVFGPNSNTFAGTIARKCGLSRPKNIGAMPAWSDSPAPALPGKKQKPGKCRLP